MSQVFLQQFLKVMISVVVLVTASELAKRSALVGAILISLPLASVLALSFLYFDTKSTEQVIALSKGIMLMILPSFAFFGILIICLKGNLSYWLSLAIASASMAGIYSGYTMFLKWLEIEI